jgi:aspartate aminotransferase/aminotransferase
MHNIDASGIRKVFDLAAGMKDPVNLSIGQPHFDTPPEIKQAFKDAIDKGHNAYSQTQGIAPLIQKIQQQIQAEYPHPDRQVFITSGTSGGLMLTLMTLINPGDEVIVFDPYFVMYKHLTTMAGGKVVLIDTYPDFKIDVKKVEAAITSKTKLILFNSPANPTGAVATAEEAKALGELAQKHNIALLSDEIYRTFCYDHQFASPATYNPDTIVIDGFSKSHSMTGHRVGFCHGPKEIIQQMLKLQQFTFVCSPQPAQWAAIAACEYNNTSWNEAYKINRDMLINALDGWEIHGAQGAFYLFVKCPWGTGTEFVSAAIQKGLLIIPGNVFSTKDTHFRISYAQPVKTIERGIEILLSLKDKPA